MFVDPIVAKHVFNGEEKDYPSQPRFDVWPLFMATTFTYLPLDYFHRTHLTDEFWRHKLPMHHAVDIRLPNNAVTVTVWFSTQDERRLPSFQ